MPIKTFSYQLAACGTAGEKVLGIGGRRGLSEDKATNHATFAPAVVEPVTAPDAAAVAQSRVAIEIDSVPVSTRSVKLVGGVNAPVENDEQIHTSRQSARVVVPCTAGDAVVVVTEFKAPLTKLNG
jgi:hypothetical protein